MLDVPASTKPVSSAKAPAASMPASASLQPTATPVPEGMPNARAASTLTTPRFVHAGATSGAIRAGQPTRSSASLAGAPSRMCVRPFDDQGSDTGEPVRCSPT